MRRRLTYAVCFGTVALLALCLGCGEDNGAQEKHQAGDPQLQRDVAMLRAQTRVLLAASEHLDNLMAALADTAPKVQVEDREVEYGVWIAASLGMAEEDRDALLAEWDKLQAALAALRCAEPATAHELHEAEVSLQSARNHLAGVRAIVAVAREHLVAEHGEERARQILGGKVEPPPWSRPPVAQHVEAKRLGVPVKFENALGMRFVLIPAGTFSMGVPPSWDRYPDEEAQHRVTIAHAFYMQTTEVSQAQVSQYVTGVDDWPAEGQRPALVSGQPAAAAFARWLSKREASRTYRLPTESEWEYACRAGTTTPYSFGESISPDQVSYKLVMRNPDWRAESPGALFPVGHFPANPWGLYEMHGNAAEWTGTVFDPGEEDTVELMLGALTARGSPPWTPVRGGGRHSPEHLVRSTSRQLRSLSDDSMGIGFRLVSPLPEKDE